ncbi:MAG: hypothetical protein IPO08_22280 [Xanthomonadales bacterium]|nr:hypothetical protein [Xanthomonadales bacterium]
MTAQTPTVLKSYFETGDRPTAAQYGDFIDTACGYKSYVALLTQSGTAAPVATVLQNTIGAVVWSRDTIGAYLCTLLGAFPAGKTYVSPRYQANAADPFTIETQRASDDAVTITAYNNAPTGVDGALTNFPIEIRVYP